MLTAYVLVSMKNIRGRQKDPTEDFIREVRKLGYVKEATPLYGAYDAFLQVECDYDGGSESGLKEVAEIKKMDDVMTATVFIRTSDMGAAEKKSLYGLMDRI
jgi:hypothetical protein